LTRNGGKGEALGKFPGQSDAETENGMTTQHSEKGKSEH